jgi:DNA-binding transcriptional regulator GbsR (MarR family)
MNKHFQTAQDICIEHAAQISSLFGLSDGMARILGLLYLSPEPVSIPAICERLSLTKGTVSLYLRMLEERKIITRSWTKRQGKQKFYEINTHLWSDFLEEFQKKARRKFQITEEAIEKSLQALKKGEKDYKGEDRIAVRLLQERLAKIRQINNLSRILLERSLLNPQGSGKETDPLTRISLSGE